MSEHIRHYDHGIVGGFWLYDSLMKNYYTQYMKAYENNKNTNQYDFFVQGNLHFTKEDWKIYAYLADCIISHNMWPANKETNETYYKCDLQELTMERFTKIRFADNPVLYILALADTIEPIKLYSFLNIDEKAICKGIDINASKHSIRIKVMNEKLPFDKLKKKIEGLDNWLDVKVNYNCLEKEIEIMYGKLD